MHALINRAVDEFLRETYPATAFDALRSSKGLRTGQGGHGLWLDQTNIAQAAEAMAKTPADMLEDLGAWLARQEPVRRLLRFSGRDFREFVSRLDELPGRARLVMPDLAVPAFAVVAGTGGALSLTLTPPDDSTLALLAGVLRVMADDYGALGLILIDEDRILIEITDDAFSAGREFQLGAAYQPMPVAGDRA